MRKYEQNREFMKSAFGTNREVSDQNRGVPVPPIEKPHDPDAKLIDLPRDFESSLRKNNLYACFKDRRSRRDFTKEPLTLAELAFLLWATQGIDQHLGPYATLRPSPSAGARHAFETYVIANRIEEVEHGVYRYLPLSHQLVLEFQRSGISRKLDEATFGQSFVSESAAVFCWSCIPYRGEWRYTSLAHKVMLLDAGHVCQNLYLACEAIAVGTCAVGAYSQEAIDSLLRLDGVDEFVVYLAPVGRVGG